MNLRRLQKSIHDAIRGLVSLWQHEQNFRLEIVVGTFFLFLSLILPMTNAARAEIMLLSTMVIVLEAINSAMEHLLDLLKPRLHDQVKLIKDIMAGTVLLASIGAAVAGAFILVGPLIEIVHQL